MKRTRLLLASFLLAPFALALVHAKAPAASPGMSLLSPAAAYVTPDIAFKTKFKALMEKGAKPEMEKLVKSESAHAAAWIARAYEILADRPDDPEALALSTDLGAAWKAAMKTTFPEKEKEFFAALAGQNKKDRVDLRKRIDQKLGEMEANSDKRDALVYANLVDEIELLAQAFGQVGDFYYSSEAWLAYAACYDEALRGTSAELKFAFKGYENAINARTKVDLNDSRQDEAMKRKAALAAKGADKSGPSAGKDEPGAPPTDAGATVNVPLNFEVVPTADAYQRPLYTGDELYLLWAGLEFKGKGSSATFQNTPGAPMLFRVGASDVRVDTDGDGKGDGPADEKVPLTGNIAAVKVNVGKGTDARPWAFLAVTGTQQETYQGIAMNRAPADTQMTIYTLGAASVTGVLDTVPIRILDDSMDAVYGSIPQTYGFAGLTKDNFQPEMDSVVLGTSKRARPWSEFQEVNGKWWKFEPADAGKSIKASPVKVDLGTLKLDFKGGIAPTWLIVRGANEMKNSFFDISEGGAKGVQLPIGRYTLYYGEIQKGKAKQMQKILVLPPKNAANYDVKKGETTVVTLGAPFGFDFRTTNVEGKLTVEGASVVVTGSQGERYERAWQCVPHPEVGWRKKGTKKASKYERMGIVQDSDAVTKLGWQAAWFPMNIDLDVKGQGDVEVQLVDKKHPLFGKVESEWKQ
jgi:hypothetical protein